MTDDLDLPPLPEVEVAAAAAVRRLAVALLGRTVNPELSARVAEAANALAAEVEAASPTRAKAEAFLRYTGEQRVHHFLTTGHWPPPPPESSEVRFDVLSFVGGPLNPLSAGARYHREGDEAVCRVTLDVGYEGPPERVHGGMVASLFDEVMGTVFRIRSMPSAFTGTLSVRFEGPAPLGVELEFRARLARTEGRKYFVEAEATGPAGRFASATAIFIELATEHMTSTYAQILSESGGGRGAGAGSAEPEGPNP